MLGKNVSAYPEVVQKVHKDGHAIGIHTWNHPVLTNIPLDEAKHEIMDTKDIIQKVTGIQTNITRPPYGSINKSCPIRSRSGLYNVGCRYLGLEESQYRCNPTGSEKRS